MNNKHTGKPRKDNQAFIDTKISCKYRITYYGMLTIRMYAFVEANGDILHGTLKIIMEIEAFYLEPNCFCDDLMKRSSHQQIW